ncbi:hypothetical protein [Deinococcus aquaedulcis]|uniref:hypothetical protein n=1 Tax=Deinococcus aquaedulcis TaxID=2840455 RepID=UPI001C831E1C|nr:hypothetical protein [Deinococcus aquaedulcis]
MITWARSKQYAILSDHDYVFLETAQGQQALGWMYGNPTGGLIDPREAWAVVIGTGLWVIRLPLADNIDVDMVPVLSSTQVFAGAGQAHVRAPLVHMMATPEDSMYVEAVYDPHVATDVVRIVADLGDRYAGVYDVNLQTLEVIKQL